MARTNNDGELKLSFTGTGIDGSMVPIALLAAKLQALQNLLFHAAAAVRRDTSARRGLWTNRYRGEAELTFVCASSGSLVVQVNLPPPLPLLVDQVDSGGNLLDLVFRFGDRLQHGGSGISELQIRQDDEDYLLRAFDALSPGPLDEYRIELANADAIHPTLVLTGETKGVIRRCLSRGIATSVQEVATLVGELIKIHVDVSPEKITVRVKGREVDCFYPNALRDQIANLLAGSIVEVTGEATLNSQSQIEKLDRVIEVFTVSMDPLRITRFEHAGAVFQLTHPLTVDVELMDGVWVYHSTRINLWGCGDRREDALVDLHENFAYLWREFALESDEVLDAQAFKIKQALLELTDSQAAGA